MFAPVGRPGIFFARSACPVFVDGLGYNCDLSVDLRCVSEQNIPQELLGLNTKIGGETATNLLPVVGWKQLERGGKREAESLGTINISIRTPIVPALRTTYFYVQPNGQHALDERMRSPVAPCELVT